LSYYVVKLLGRKNKLKPESFLPPWLRPKPKPQSAEELRLYLETWAGGANGGERATQRGRVS
jgi:hypothetical protein